MIRSRIRTVTTAALGVAFLSAAVACSSAASADQPPGNHDAFMQCMTENGVPAPLAGGPDGHGGPPVGGAMPAPPGVDQQTWDNARQACESLAPAPPPRA